MLITERSSYAPLLSKPQSEAAESELTISVVIPLYNGAPFIVEALESVFSQTLRPREVIVVNDGSTDNGADIVARYARVADVTLLHKSNGGQSSARNFGIRHATGDVIALLDQDDTWYPTHLAELIKPFLELQHRPLGWAYSNLDEINKSGEIVSHSVLVKTSSPHPKTDIIECLRQDMFILPSASLIARQAFNAVGGFDERLSGYEDDDLFLRLFRAGYDNVYIDRPLSRWRIYPESTSFSRRMSISRMIFAHKLVETFPDEKASGVFYARDLIVPRFFHHTIETLRRSLRAGDGVWADTCREQLDELEAMVPASQRSRLFQTDHVVTAVITLRNGATTIERAIRSVLNQILSPDEVIVVDDGSTDDGPDIVNELAKSLPIKVVSQEQAGLSSARNLGIQHAHGDLIALLEQGDVWYPNHLIDLVTPFKDQRPRLLGWAYGDVDQIGNSNELIGQSVLKSPSARHPKVRIRDCLGPDMLLPLSACLISRKAFNALGGFDTALQDFEGEDLFLRMLQAGYENAFVERSVSAWYLDLEDAARARRVTESGMVYARKLIDLFNDDDEVHEDYIEELIAPRFAGITLKEAQRALATGDEAWVDICFAHVAFLDGFLSNTKGASFIERPPIISAVIPLFNGAEFIEEALRSVLAQTLPPDEIIVVDDGSTDGGPDIVEGFKRNHPIRLIRQSNTGQAAARNTGVDYSHGDLIAFLDQDDVWYPNHLEELVKPFRQKRNSPFGWSYSDLDEVDKAGDVTCRGVIRSHLSNSHPKLDLLNCLKQDMFILPSASLISRHAFLHIGGFDERLSGYEDDDLFLRLFRAGFESAFLPASLSRWRIFDCSSSYSPRMATSRMIYARSLIDRFPDDPTRSLYYVSDLIAPRFLRSMLSHFRRCVLRSDRSEEIIALNHLAFIVRYVRWRWRLPLQCFVIPVMRVPPLARFIVHHHAPLSRLFRRVF